MRLMEDELAVPGDYQGPWDYIYEDVHSLERGPNLHLLLRRAIGERG